MPVKVLKTPVGSMSSKAIRSTTSTTNGMTMREIAEALDETLLQKDGWLEHEDSSDVCERLRWWSSQVRRLRSPPPCSDATLLAAVKAHSRVP